MLTENMKEIAFQIEYEEDRDVVSIYENGMLQQTHIYHKGRDERTLILQTVVDWYGLEI